ncbi:hypothetical protein EC957_000916 [Mortierella hygrophila]|uniref:Uncharacterized protein n=1 Tax=Mortierella hygrophila TaxID=979708 RepID=A0A9P6F5G7_9FUNG|nr:hypothetical protein EC957_000916 [Mortierella hygrophila]
MAPHFTIAPGDSNPSPRGSGPEAQWAYLSFDYGPKGYRLDLTRNSTTLAHCLRSSRSEHLQAAHIGLRYWVSGLVI